MLPNFKPRCISTLRSHKIYITIKFLIKDNQYLLTLVAKLDSTDKKVVQDTPNSLSCDLIVLNLIKMNRRDSKEMWLMIRQITYKNRGNWEQTATEVEEYQP